MHLCNYHLNQNIEKLQIPTKFLVIPICRYVHPVMINFIHRRDWTIGCPDIWSNIILGVSMRVFVDEFNI